MSQNPSALPGHNSIAEPRRGARISYLRMTVISPREAVRFDMTKFLHTRNNLIDVQVLDPEPKDNLCEAQGFRHRVNLLVLEMLFKQPEAFDAIVTGAVTRDGVCPSYGTLPNRTTEGFCRDPRRSARHP